MSRSVRLHEFGGPDVLKIEDVVVPDPGFQEVRLRVKAIGLNRSEVLTRSGKSAIKPTLPAQLGLEAAGVIEAVGSGVEGFVVGDRVAVIPADFELVPTMARSLLRRRGRSSKYLMTRTGRKRRPPGWRSARLGPG